MEISDTTAVPSVLFVDDEPHILAAYRRMLHSYSVTWNMSFAGNGREACDAIRSCAIDVVVTDISMPVMSGLELLEALQQEPATRHIPTIVVTGHQQRDLKRQALDRGATDLLTKPVEFEELVARISSSFRLKKCHDELQFHNAELERRVAERTRQLSQSRLEIIARLSKAAEFRDSETGRHVIRVAHYSRLIAQALQLPAQQVDSIFAAAPLHDVGKIGIPDSILLKSGPLTEEERSVMRTHCEIGDRILGIDLDQYLDTHFCGGTREKKTDEQDDPVLHTARQIAASHHEQWDGSGYPAGLAGEDIPLPGRIVAIADVFDALMTARPYKPAYSLEESLRCIADRVGKHFDPRVHAAFLAALPEIESLREFLADDGPSLKDSAAEILKQVRDAQILTSLFSQTESEMSSDLNAITRGR